MQISKSNFDFLNQIKKNNNREWFNKNKEWYLSEHQNTIDFADALIEELNKEDLIETSSGKKSLFRIYRDVRFGKDKSPYKTSWSGGFKRATNQRRGGYYFHLEPGKSVAAGGFWGPSSTDIALIRAHIAQDDSSLRKVINSKSFIDTFGTLEGVKVKTAPRGYVKDHPSIDLLKYKQFLLTHSFTDKQVLSKNFVHQIAETMLKMRPFFDCMTEMLTTDMNGISLVE